MFDLLTCWVASELPFKTPDGSELVLREIQCMWEGEGSTVSSFTLRFQVDLATWQRIDAAEHFGLDVARRGEHSGGGFRGEAPVEIEARLKPQHLALVNAERVVDILDAATEILISEILCSTEAWDGMLAVQERIPGLKTGFAMNGV